MPKLKTGTIMPTPEEDAEITAAAMSDPDAMPLTDAEWEAVKPHLKRGRPAATHPLKISTTLRMDADVLNALRATGRGWQTRLNDTMREWVKTHSAG
ncbi:MAG: BrnA antitoxin family protein [Gallionella sp.]